MTKDKRDNKVEPVPEGTSQGEHGGNRGGDSREDSDQPKKSSPAAGKDPHRGKE